MAKDILGMDRKGLSNLTLNELEQKMREEQFDDNLIKDLMEVLKQRLIKYGESEFQKWLYNLNFRCPEEFQNESLALEFYERNHAWIEEQTAKLEQETNISWLVQAEDLKDYNINARKVQLVIRHRLSEIVLELI
ncbi:hypothetical protein [Saliterribacillus persicus]|uniref:Uncharacterized protein n=1 Tax=Saliterribacillus persicus TaxID=930114 RepID=A0A368Y0Z7_9BACI|nr:hypothetical protein [Saliterribacillus persicus]RCW73066.1 hypothetical protein DFR57_10461 [Saliterribacillus persicus]